MYKSRRDKEFQDTDGEGSGGEQDEDSGAIPFTDAKGNLIDL